MERWKIFNNQLFNWQRVHPIFIENWYIILYNIIEHKILKSIILGAEPSPAYFNILMWGNKTEVLDGTQLAADYTFSGLQKFGQGLEDRLRGLKLPSKLLEKVSIRFYEQMILKIIFLGSDICIYSGP